MDKDRVISSSENKCTALQVDYYGTSVANYNSHIQASRGKHAIKDAEYDKIINSHLDKIQALNIVDTS